MIAAGAPQRTPYSSTAVQYRSRLYSSTGFLCIEGELVLNREKHPIFDTTNCVQGTYVM
jgi:hypothetical protein